MHHTDLLEELYDRFGQESSSATLLARQWRLRRKKYSWMIVVTGSQWLKWLLDIGGALVLLAGLSPVLLLSALCIKLTSRGPVLFWQIRVGRWGREFWLPKFRSMHVHAEAYQAALLAQNEHQEGVTFKMKRDPRVTPLGRIIRKTSIDELPQLLNVLRGQMSLVGPRPPLPREVAGYTVAERRRLDVKPGLTCLWQVRGRGNLPFPEQVQLDIQYIESHNLWLDLKILMQTIPAVLLGRGAY